MRLIDKYGASGKIYRLQFWKSQPATIWKYRDIETVVSAQTIRVLLGSGAK
jgi:hypothetical protein